MKNKVVVALLIIFIICFSFFAFIFWYNYFLRLGSDGKLSGIDKENEIVSLIDENKIYAIFDEGMEEPINVDGYKFRVENKSSKEVRYNLIFKEIDPNVVNDGCTNKTVLKDDELNYQLFYRNNVISQGRVNQISNSILDSRIISGNDQNSYELKVWLNSNSDNNEGKHYHYKVELKVQE